MKFGAQDPGCKKELSAEFKLKRQIAELFEYIRSVGAGEIQIKLKGASDSGMDGGETT